MIKVSCGGFGIACLTP
ncbi:DUF3265 domain-containing protein [Aeromonas enteropelogenes]|nr:DUF3265 domain-containing protein [Aeromonas enteropelogenes]